MKRVTHPVPLHSGHDMFHCTRAFGGFWCTRPVDETLSKGRCLLFLDEVIDRLEDAMRVTRQAQIGPDVTEPPLSVFRKVVNLRKFLEFLGEEIRTADVTPDYEKAENLTEYTYEMLAFALNNMRACRVQTLRWADFQRPARDAPSLCAQTLDNLIIVLRRNFQHVL